MKLFIDSTDNTKVVIRLDDKEYIHKVDNPREQNVFGFLIDTITSAGFTQKDITEVEVNPGPGSFTGTRIGVSIANALGFALKIPVNGSNSPVKVIYSAPPSITLKKK